MAIDFYNKPKVWTELLGYLAEEIDFGTLTNLQKHAYLDSVERGIALIGCKSYTWMETFQRKYLQKKIEAVFAEHYNIQFTVKFVLGRPRIIEKRKPSHAQKAYENALQTRAWGDEPEVQSATTGWLPEPKPTNSSELAALHAKYGDIMGIVDRMPIFRVAQTPMERGGWGFHKQTLTNYCKEYGVEAVLKGLRETANKPNVLRPRAYFADNLKAGRWGHKLAVTPSIIGPALEPV